MYKRAYFLELATLLKAVAAVHRAGSVRLERDLCFLAALCACYVVHLSGATEATASVAASGSLVHVVFFPGFATRSLVHELLFISLSQQKAQSQWKPQYHVREECL